MIENESKNVIMSLNHALTRGAIKNHVLDDLFLAISFKVFSKSAAHPLSRFTPASVALGVSEKLPTLSLAWKGHLFAQVNDAKFQDS